MAAVNPSLRRTNGFRDVLCGEFDPERVVDQAVENHRRDRRLAGDDGRTAIVTLLDDLPKIMASRGIEGISVALDQEGKCARPEG